MSGACRSSLRTPTMIGWPAYPTSFGVALERRIRDREAVVAEHERHGPRLAPRACLEEVHRRRADEARHERRWRARRRGPAACRPAGARPSFMHRDAVTHRHRLDLVVRDVDRGRPELVLEPGDLGPHLHAELRVEVRERLVHEEDLGLRARSRVPSRRAGADRPRAASACASRYGRRGRASWPPMPPAASISAFGVLRSRRPKAMFSPTAQVRVERVVLEHHRDVAILRRQVVDDPVADRDRAVGDLLEPGDHAQGRRLAAPGRPDEHEELAVLDLEGQVLHGVEAVVVDLVDFVRAPPQPRLRLPRHSILSTWNDRPSHRQHDRCVLHARLLRPTLARHRLDPVAADDVERHPHRLAGSPTRETRARAHRCVSRRYSDGVGARVRASAGRPSRAPATDRRSTIRRR